MRTAHFWEIVDKGEQMRTLFDGAFYHKMFRTTDGMEQKPDATISQAFQALLDLEISLIVYDDFHDVIKFASVLAK